LEKKPDLAAWIAWLLLFMIVYNASLSAGELDGSLPEGSDWMGKDGSSRLPWERGIEGWRQSLQEIRRQRADWKGPAASGGRRTGRGRRRAM
jgi:hypothetical protein